METPEMFSAILGLPLAWRVTVVGFVKESNRLDISVEIDEGKHLICAVCGALGTVCYLHAETETWCHKDFFCYTTFLHARVPHLACNCGVVPLELPWCRAGSGFLKVQ